MYKRLLPVLFCLFFGSADARVTYADMRECPDLESCVAIIADRVSNSRDIGIFSDTEGVALILRQRFGRPARDRFVEFALDEEHALSFPASRILGFWEAWSVEDLDILRKLLERHPYPAISILLDLDAPEALQLVVAYLPQFEESGGGLPPMLEQAGPEILPMIFPYLEQPARYSPWEEWYEDSGFWREIARFIRTMAEEATVLADDWLAIAKSPEEPLPRRLAALRGLTAMGGHLGERARELRPLRQSTDPDIAAQAFDALVEARDPSVVREVAQECQPRAEKWDVVPLAAWICLDRVAAFGENGRAVGDRVLPFLQSQNRMEQLFAIETLSLIGYREAIPAIEAFLTSQDWRHVFAATKALGVLRAYESAGAINRATKDHWYFELQHYGSAVTEALGRKQPYRDQLNFEGKFRLNDLELYTDPFNEFPFLTWDDSCPSQTWLYRGHEISFAERSFQRETRIDLPGGTMVGTDGGEFGGTLVWRADNADPVTLVDDNTLFLFRTERGILSIHGISHLNITYGFAVLSAPDGRGGYRAEEVVRFPAEAHPVLQLEDDLFAARVRDQVFVFSTSGIKRQAYCDVDPMAASATSEQD